MQVAVTGGTGHVGVNLVPELLAQGHRVRVLVHEDTHALDGLDVEPVPGDVRDPAAVRALVDGAELVYHVAARITIVRRDKLAEEINGKGPAVVAAACRDAGVRRLVHVSSIHAFQDHPLDQPIDETRALADRSVNLAYSRSKAAGQRAVLEAVRQGLDAVIVNPTSVLGRNDWRPSPMGEVLWQLATGKLPALLPAAYDFVDVRDVVAGMLAAADKGRSGECYLLAGHRHTLHELAAMVEARTGTPAPRWTSPMWAARLAAPFATGWARVVGKRPKFTSASLEVLRGNTHIRRDKAGRELGHDPRPITDTIDDLVQWWHEAGRLDGRPGGAR